jgi:hypothetical protein
VVLIVVSSSIHMSVAEHHHHRPRTEPRRSFTTRLPLAILAELDRASEETGLRKNEILVQAFTEWNKRRRQARLAESYRQSPLGQGT